MKQKYDQVWEQQLLSIIEIAFIISVSRSQPRATSLENVSSSD